MSRWWIRSCSFSLRSISYPLILSFLAPLSIAITAKWILRYDIYCTHSVFLVFLRKNNNKISYLQIFLVKSAILCVNAIPFFILRRYNNHPPSPNRRMVEGWLGNNVTINSVLAYIYCNVVIVMLCPKVMCNACAVFWLYSLFYC